MDEFGSGNSNLHAHGVYAGPYLPQHLLSAWWQEITGDSYIVSIKPAMSFDKALSHALKYPSKFWDAPPLRLAELEKAFHKVRRFHTLARFYNPPETQTNLGWRATRKTKRNDAPAVAATYENRKCDRDGLGFPFWDRRAGSILRQHASSQIARRCLRRIMGRRE
jgi:hypothetical protein